MSFWNLGAFAVYLEPWHADIFEFLDLRKNHGKVILSLVFLITFEYENSNLSVFCNNCNDKLTVYMFTATLIPSPKIYFLAVPAALKDSCSILNFWLKLVSYGNSALVHILMIYIPNILVPYLWLSNICTCFVFYLGL